LFNAKIFDYIQQNECLAIKIHKTIVVVYLYVRCRPYCMPCSGSVLHVK